MLTPFTTVGKNIAMLHKKTKDVNLASFVYPKVLHRKIGFDTASMAYTFSRMKGAIRKGLQKVLVADG